jgi:hypothetical protein
MFLVLTYERTSELSSTVFTVVEVRVIVVAEAEIVLMIAAVMAVA